MSLFPDWLKGIPRPENARNREPRISRQGDIVRKASAHKSGVGLHEEAQPLVLIFVIEAQRALSCSHSC